MNDTITLPRKVVQQAIELLESAHVSTALVWPRYECVTALKAALAAPQPMNDGLDEWLTPEAVFEAKLAAHGIPNHEPQPVKQAPKGDD